MSCGATESPLVVLESTRCCRSDLSHFLCQHTRPVLPTRQLLLLKIFIDIESEYVYSEIVCDINAKRLVSIVIFLPVFSVSESFPFVTIFIILFVRHMITEGQVTFAFPSNLSTDSVTN